MFLRALITKLNTSLSNDSSYCLKAFLIYSVEELLKHLLQERDKFWIQWGDSFRNRQDYFVSHSWISAFKKSKIGYKNTHLTIFQSPFTTYRNFIWFIFRLEYVRARETRRVFPSCAFDKRLFGNRPGVVHNRMPMPFSYTITRIFSRSCKP